MSLTKKKVTILALSFITAISTLFGALLLTPNTVKADNRTAEEILAESLNEKEKELLAVGDSIVNKWLLITVTSENDSAGASLTPDGDGIAFMHEMCNNELKILPFLTTWYTYNSKSLTNHSIKTTYNGLTGYYVKIDAGDYIVTGGIDNETRTFNLTAENTVDELWNNGATIYKVIEDEPTSLVVLLSDIEKTPVTTKTVIVDKWLCYNPDRAVSYIFLNNNGQIYLDVDSATQTYVLTALNPNDNTDAIFPYKGEFYKDTRYVDTAGYYLYFKIPSGTYTGTFKDGTTCNYVLDENTRVSTAEGVLYELNARPDPGAGVPGLARYEKHYISGQFWRVYGSRTVACDSNMRLEMACIAGTDKLTLFTSGSENKVQVGFDVNNIIQNQVKDTSGKVIYTDFYMPETIISTTGNYLTSNLVIHSDYVDYIYLITDPQTVCPTVYAQVNVTPEEPGQSPTLPGEPDFPSTEDPNTPPTEDPSNPGTDDPATEEPNFGDKIKDGLQKLTDWFNDNTGLGVSSSIVGFAVIIIVISLLRRRR